MFLFIFLNLTIKHTILFNRLLQAHYRIRILLLQISDLIFTLVYHHHQLLNLHLLRIIHSSTLLHLLYAVYIDSQCIFIAADLFLLYFDYLLIGGVD